MAVDEAVAKAVYDGGLEDAERFLNECISSVLSSTYGIHADARIVRFNDFDELAAFYFDVVAGDLSVRFRLDGVRDPLIAIRLGLDWRWREDPNHPYEIHGESSVMTDCLNNHYFHLAADAPDFFARLENRTEDPYHYGAETFLSVDHLYLGGGGLIDEPHRVVYGLK